MSVEPTAAAVRRPAAAMGARSRIGALTSTRLSGVVLVLVLLGLWEASARLHWVDSQSWPAFSAVLAATWHGLGSGELSTILAASLARMFVGFFIGGLGGIALGLLLGTVPLFDRLVTPVAETLRPLPIPAIVPPLILFLGLDNALKIFVVAFSVFFPMVVSTVGGIRDIDGVLHDTARTLGTRWLRTLIRVTLPAALPAILSGLRINLSLALITTVVAEMIAGSSGIGYYIIVTQYALRPDQMYAAVLCLAIVGYALNRGFLAVERRLLHWYVAPPR